MPNAATLLALFLLDENKLALSVMHQNEAPPMLIQTSLKKQGVKFPDFPANLDLWQNAEFAIFHYWGDRDFNPPITTAVLMG